MEEKQTSAGKMPFRNAVSCFLGALIWGTAFVAQRIGSDEISAMTFVGLRFLMGFAVLLPLVIVRERLRGKRILQKDRTVEPVDHRQSVRGGIVCGIALVTASWLQQVAIPYVPVGKAGFLTALYIIIVPILSFFFTRRSRARVWIAAAISAVGLYFLCMKPGESFHIGRWELILIGCALMFSVQIMSIDHFAARTDGVELSCMQFLTAGVIGTVIAAGQGDLSLAGVSAGALLSLLYAGIFSSGIAYTLQIVGQKGADPAIASLIMSLESVISAVSAFFILHQTLSGRELVGCVLMASAIVLVQLPVKKTTLLMSLLSVLFLGGCGSAPGVDTGNVETQGSKLLQAGSYQEAADFYQQQIDAKNTGAENYRCLGISLMGLGDYKKAAEAFETALSESGIIPTDSDYDINYYLGSCYDKLGDYESALEVYDAIVVLRPKDADALELRGGVKMQMGDTEGMQKDFSKAISLEPSNYDRLLSIYSAMASNGYEEEGKKYLQDALDQSSDSMSGYDRGRIAYYVGDYDTARTNLEQLQNNTDEKVVLMLGRTYEALGDYNYATNVYKTFLSSDTTHPEVYNQLGLCCMKMEDYESALDAFQEGKKLGGTECLQSLSFNEIVAYEHLGEFEQAQALMETYLKSYPGDEKAKREEIFLSTR